MQNITGQSYAPGVDERVIIGIDTGKKLDYVLGNKKGLFFHGDAQDYAELDGFMTRWPKAIAIIDAGGDLINQRHWEDHRRTECGRDEQNPPRARDFAFSELRELVRQRAEAAIVFDDGRAAEFRWRREFL